jgi:hypothetical protein
MVWQKGTGGTLLQDLKLTLGVSDRLDRATGPGGYLAADVGQGPSVAGLAGAPLVHGSLEFRLHVDVRVADPVHDLVTVDAALGQEVVELLWQEC